MTLLSLSGDFNYTHTHTHTLIFCFLGPYPQHMEVSRLRVKLELQLLAYTTATATQDPRHICDLHHCLRQRWLLRPLNRARDRTHVLMDTSWYSFLLLFNLLIYFWWRLLLRTAFGLCVWSLFYGTGHHWPFLFRIALSLCWLVDSGFPLVSHSSSSSSLARAFNPGDPQPSHFSPVDCHALSWDCILIPLKTLSLYETPLLTQLQNHTHPAPTLQRPQCCHFFCKTPCIP